MAAAKIPYPPSPTDVPEGLTDYPATYIRQQNIVLAGMFVFLIFYIAAILLLAMVGIWCVLTFVMWPAVKVIGIVVSTLVLLFLLKGFFKRRPLDKEVHIEITEDDQPVLFGFINRLCDELEAPEPDRVFLSPDVNAAVMPRTSLVNLFVEPKKDLLIGLGLVNCLNLSEFKSVVAHEFGHFCQQGPARNYAVIVQDVILNIVVGEDWLDRLAERCKQIDALRWLGFTIGGFVWLGRTILWWIFTVLTLQFTALLREKEFHADLVAVKAAGSDAVGLSLLRLRFGNLCLNQAIDDLIPAARDHKLYSRDIFLHQELAAEVVRRKRNEPNLGIPPVHAHPMAGESIRVFDPEQEELEDDIPEMLKTHPPAHETEENAKATFVPAVIDHRSPWLLFTEPGVIKERMSYKFYRRFLRVPKNVELADAQRVQEYIDNEHAETTYDVKYHGAYDERILEPGDLDELNTVIHSSPWNDDRLEKVYAKILDGCREHAEAHSDLHKELQALNSQVVGKPSPRIKKKIKEIEEKLDTNREWFKSFDRRVYLLHVQMAGGVKSDWKEELIERYKFQMTVQRFYRESRDAFDKADMYLSVLVNSNPNEVPSEFIGEVLQVLRESWKTLRQIIRDARETNLPAMKNFEEGERLADFILPEKMVPEPPLDYAKGVWIDKLMRQLDGVRTRCFRLHFKSVGGILALQERIAAAWKEASAPVCAEVVEPEAVLAEAVPAEVVVEGFVDELPAEEVVLAAEIIPAEVVVESFVEALPVDDVDEPPPLISPAPASLDPGGLPMAAFRSTAPPPVAAVETRHSAAPLPDASPPLEPVSAAVLEELPPPLPPSEPEKPAGPARPVVPAVEFSVPELSDASATLAVPKESPGAVEIGFSLDLGAGRMDASASPVPAEEIFSLDADAVSAAEAAPGAAVFSLDADADIIDVEPIEDEGEPVVAEILEEPSIGSGSVAAPAARQTPGTGSSASMPALSELVGTGKNGLRKRPPVKITLVGPGQKSPFA